MTGFNSASSRKREEAEVDALIQAAAGNTDAAAQPAATEQHQENAPTEPGTPTDATQQQPAPGSTEPNQAQPEPPTPPKATEDDEEATFKARYQALRGKYDKEVPALHDEIRQLKSRLDGSTANTGEVAELKRQITGLQEQLAAAKANPPQQQTPANAPALDDLRREYGDELVDGIVNHIQTTLAPISEKVETVSKRADQSRGEAFKTSLSAVLAAQGIDFNDYNADPAFLDWLRWPDSDQDPTPRQQLLNAAVSNGDVQTSAGFFARYKASLGASQDGSPNPLEQHQDIGNNGGPAPDNLPPADGLTPLQRWEEGTELYLRGKITAEELDRLEREMYAAHNGG